ncbi:tetratricopeptide repeat protein [Parapedobacter sp. SGR-10]|uniref:tetratricopeptide repeat protein n=1 Tax=Parapedobacter sp. SGR-10 TaxID=2710879 RepID=UPI0013D10FB2|nr:tetratricopeptide repeat protein [Parapedobacter sp. SGR-10]NGF55098.1 tetratricopeptide repeat protein [Parapedobacter sp. SGR-10]
MHKRVIWIVVILIAGMMPARSQEKETPYKKALEAVEVKLRAGDFRGAIADLDQITTQYPEEADVYYAKGLLLGQMGDYEGAVTNARIAYEKEASLQNLQFLMDLYRARKNWEDLVELLKDFRAKNPTMSFVGRELMATLGGLKKFDEALQIYDEEVKAGRHSDSLDVAKADILIRKEDLHGATAILKPWDGKSSLRQVYGTLGFIYGEQRKNKQAIEVLERGLKITSDPVLYLDLADAYREEKKPRQSYEALKAAFNAENVDFGDKHRVMLTLMDSDMRVFSRDQIQELANILVLKHPRIAESHVIKGNILWRRGNIQEARSLFLTAVGISPNHVDAWRLLINTDMALRSIDDAVRHSHEALSVNPGNPMLLYFAGLSYMMKEDYDNSRKMLEAALDQSGNENTYLQSMIYGALGDLYHQLKMDAASDVAYEEAIALDSTNVTVLNNYAYYLSVRKKDLEKAERYSRMSNEMEPNSATFQDTYAWVLFQQAKYKEALTWIEKAMRGTQTSAVLYEHYGDILSMVGREKDALKQWEKALTMSKENTADIQRIQTKIKEKRYVE